MYRIGFFVLSYFVFFSRCIAQADTSFIELNSKMYFISEIDHEQVMMDEEGNQFDRYNNYIVVDFENGKLKIPYDHNYIFWDEYDEDTNVKKKDVSDHFEKNTTI